MTEWTQLRLKECARKCLGGRKLVVVSNREPFAHVLHEGSVTCTEPAGGLASAMKPILSAVSGTWVAHGSGNADWNFTDDSGRLPVPPNEPRFTLRRIRIPDQLRKPYYDGLSNQALWPLCHNVYQRPSFRELDWQAYSEVNRLFADSVLDEVGDEDAVVLVQDYHLALLPALLKKWNPSLTVAQFWHIPWTASEIMETLPWIDDLMEGLLANDLLGFHLARHCRNFLDTVEARQAGAIDRDQAMVWTARGATKVRDIPISIDFHAHSAESRSETVNAHMAAWKQRVGATTLFIGIDRVDYTKGIPERLRAFELLLERCPELRGNITFVQVGVPSRTGIPAFASLQARIVHFANTINQRWGNAAWNPVILEMRTLAAAEMMALHRLAHVCVVSSLHDGMNLVAKEFVASRFDQDGVLVLSRFAGTAQEMSAAIQVNPFSEESLFEGLFAALRMPAQERRLRMAGMRTRIERNNIFTWAANLMEEIRVPAAAEPARQFAHGFSVGVA